MKDIKWCLNTNHGMELVEPNENLSKAYLKKAEGSLEVSSILKGKREWEITSAYYAQYLGIYAILMRIGVKCEIHSCTIAFMKEFLTDYFTKEDVKLISKSHKGRNDLQYYSDRSISEELHLKIINNTPLFLTKCKQVLSEINENEIILIRNKINKTKFTNFN